MTDEQKFVLEKNLTRFDSYINAINTKAAFLVSFNTFILGTVLLKYDAILTPFMKPWLANSATFLLCLCLVSVAVVIFYSFLAVNPFLKAGVPDGEPATLFFFKSVAQMSKSSYKKRLSELKREEIFQDLVNQTFILASAADAKFIKIKYAIAATMFGTILTLFLVAVLRVIDFLAN